MDAHRGAAARLAIALWLAGGSALGAADGPVLGPIAPPHPSLHCRLYSEAGDLVFATIKASGGDLVEAPAIISVDSETRTLAFQKRLIGPSRHETSEWSLDRRIYGSLDADGLRITADLQPVAFTDRRLQIVGEVRARSAAGEATLAVEGAC
ncbi:MAG: hypothetical protein AAFR11_15475 [Pseudomonadota bacterium]